MGNGYESLPVIYWGTGTSHCLCFIGERVRVTACSLLGNGYESLPVVYWGTGTSQCPSLWFMGERGTRSMSGNRYALSERVEGGWHVFCERVEGGGMFLARGWRGGMF